MARQCDYLPAVNPRAKGTSLMQSSYATQAGGSIGVAVCCSVKARAMTSLQETCEGVLQYLEAAAEGEVPPEEPLILPSIRCLGR